MNRLVTVNKRCFGTGIFVPCRGSVLFTEVEHIVTIYRVLCREVVPVCSWRLQLLPAHTHTHLHDSDGVSPMDVTVLAEFLPE